MNFLSHYYFDRHNNASNEVTGALLPDLVKNAHKEWNFYPQKKEPLFKGDRDLEALLSGWKKHLLVDKYFHSSEFFSQHTANLKADLKPLLEDTAVRPSFLAHITLELLLDHLLIENQEIITDDLYAHLEKTDDLTLDEFLKRCGNTDNALFFDFFERFKASRYLFSYQKIENISHALRRICMRIWPDAFSEETASRLTPILEAYKKKLCPNYLQIFDEINIFVSCQLSK